VSMFGTMFMALEGWISATSLAHIYGKERHEEDTFLSVRGREYSRQVVIGNEVSAKALRTICKRRVWQALPEVVRALSIHVPMSTLELAIVRTLSLLHSCFSCIYCTHSTSLVPHFCLPWASKRILNCLTLPFIFQRVSSESH
jgi:hypothetical protein